MDIHTPFLFIPRTWREAVETFRAIRSVGGWVESRHARNWAIMYGFSLVLMAIVAGLTVNTAFFLGRPTVIGTLLSAVTIAFTGLICLAEWEFTRWYLLAKARERQA